MNSQATNTIGKLHQIQDMLIGLVENLNEQQFKTHYVAGMGSPGWYLGQAVYLETYLIREVMQHDADMTARVRHFFDIGIEPDAAISDQLPPKEHLLNWALELQEDNLTRLANPSVFGNNPKLDPDWLATYLLQRHAISYENMLILLQGKAIAEDNGMHMVTMELLAETDSIESVLISQGHYRIGARDEEITFDIEKPAQMVELANFRIATKPVSNANYLSFMNDGGYENPAFWTKQGWQWRQTFNISHPWHWKKNPNGRWYEINILGAADLPPDEPVMGISQYEASAFSQWLAQHHEKFQGAVLQHEYQWETAARQGALQMTGRAREWCSNDFDLYPGYQQPDDITISLNNNKNGKVIKGLSLHSQPSIRRMSLRKAADAGNQHLLTGVRLVFPPGKPFWEQ